MQIYICKRKLLLIIHLCEFYMKECVYDQIQEDRSNNSCQNIEITQRICTYYQSFTIFI